MLCKWCNSPMTQVVDTNKVTAEDGGVVVRKRKCKACHRVFNTFEVYEDPREADLDTNMVDASVLEQARVEIEVATVGLKHCALHVGAAKAVRLRLLAFLAKLEG